MPDSETVCPNGSHHPSNESLSLKEVTSVTKVYRANAFTYYNSTAWRLPS